MNINLVKGTHDIFYDEIKYYQEIEKKFILLAKIYNYHEFRTPILEYTTLFKRNNNDSSDIVRKQMYNFFDLKGRELTLRPEFTASIVRCIVNNKLDKSFLPIKAYYLGPIFRYERPKTGTYRQFSQFGIENIGFDNEYIDAETIAFGYRALQKINLKINLKINSLGDEISRNNYKKELKNFFASKIKLMCCDCQKRFELNPLRILDCKDIKDKKIILDAPKINFFLNNESKKRFKKTLILLKKMKIPYEIDLKLVRGLDYYSHIIYEYELISKINNVGAIGGGGHYDNLVYELGGKKISGSGFAFGIERIFTVLKNENLLDKLLIEKNDIDFIIMPTNNNLIKKAFIINDYLRKNNIKSEAILINKNFSSMFHDAEKYNAKFAIIIGEKENKKKQIIIRNLSKKTQKIFFIKNLKKICKNLLLKNAKK